MTSPRTHTSHKADWETPELKNDDNSLQSIEGLVNDGTDGGVQSSS